tara:strand:- start:216 stop:518 length:303 start_codon:yes stop_codon:yes gene_type:complete
VTLFNFKKYSALLLLLAGMFVANNLAHDSSHIGEFELDEKAFSQDECDTCHVFKGTIFADSRTLPSILVIAEATELVHASVALNPRFPLYLSRAPPRVKA